VFDTPFSIPVIAIICWCIVAVVRAKNGVGPMWHHRSHNLQTPPMFQKLLDKEMAERDAEIQQLRGRVEVLEKIVTDSHKSSSLADEIERLRDRA
jgi:hypothetical protein